MEPVRVSERRPTYEMVRWDGTAESEEWITEHFGEQGASFSGEPGHRVFTMWNTWEIPLGDFIVDRWGFSYVPADQLNEQFQNAAPLIKVQPLPDPPVDEPPADEPPAEEPPAEEPPAEEPPAEEPPAEEPPAEPGAGDDGQEAGEQPAGDQGTPQLP